MIEVSFPKEVNLSCPGCKTDFTLRREYLDQTANLHCPLCGQRFAVYDRLQGKLKLKLYEAVRNHIEGRVYEQQRIDQSDYFEDSGNLL